MNQAVFWWWSLLGILITDNALSSDEPNFVLFLADDLGIGDVGCFGNTTIRTPNIDSMAAKGVKLNHHLAAAAVCTPSRAALLTGRYPVRSGMESSGRNKVFFFVAASGGLPQNETTIAQALKQKGYATAIIGKWHLGNDCDWKGDMCHHPLKHGFDRFYGLPLSNCKDFGDEGQSVITSYVPNFYTYITILVACGLCLTVHFFPKHRKLSFLVLFAAVFIPVVTSIFLRNLKIINGVVMRNEEVVEQPVKLEGLTQRFVQEATMFLREQATSGTPFFLFFPFVHVHTALFTATEFKGKSQHGRYGDNVEELDWAIGKLLEALNNLGLAENTFLYFSSDNGGHVEEIGADGQREGGHNGIYKGGKTMAGMEGGIRVPSIVSWPGHFNNGAEVQVPTSQMDILPTMMEIASIPLPNDRIIDGKSLLPLLTGKVTKSPHQVLFHYCGTSIHASTYIAQDEDSVWKIHWFTPKFLPGTTRCEFVCHCFGQFVVHHEPPLLYNLVSDPSESHPIDVSSSPKYQTIISVVNELLVSHKGSVDTVPNQFSFSNTMWKPWLQSCCNFPQCSCTDSKYSIS